jgi:ketosteroid isomerase-like protein
MTTDNVEVVRRLFRAVEERDIEPMYDIYAPDVVVQEASSLPRAVRWARRSLDHA